MNTIKVFDIMQYLRQQWYSTTMRISLASSTPVLQYSCNSVTIRDNKKVLDSESVLPLKNFQFKFTIFLMESVLGVFRVLGQYQFFAPLSAL
jgi:hypothetical protein